MVESPVTVSTLKHLPPRTLFVLSGTANLADLTYLIKEKNIGSPLNLRMAASSSGTRPAFGVWFLSRRLGRQEAADIP